MHKPPVAKRVPVTSLRHGREVVDEYAWLRDRDDPDTVAYLEAENAYTDAWFAPHADAAGRLFEEIKRRIQETDLSVPVAQGPWWYVTRTEEGRQYPIHCRAARARRRRRRAGPARRERRGGRPRLLRARRFDVSPTTACSRSRRDVDRRRGLHLRFRDLDHRRRPARPIERHLLRHGLVGRRPLPLLHAARRRDAAVPGLAPRARHAADDDVLVLPGGRRALLRRRRLHRAASGSS